MTSSPRGIDSPVRSGDDAGPPDRGPTRRQALVLAGGTAALLGATAGPFGGLFTAGAADDDTPPEMALASWLMGLELAAAELYDRARETSEFDDAARELAMRCAANHTAQADALGEMVSAGGGDTPEGPNDAFIDRYRPRFDGAPGANGKADILAGIENSFAATYQGAFETLTSPSLAALIARILATDAAQAVAWSAVAADDGLPPEDAIPESQTDQDRFSESELQPSEPDDEDGESDDDEDDQGPADAPDDPEEAVGADQAEADDTATSMGDES